MAEGMVIAVMEVKCGALVPTAWHLAQVVGLHLLLCKLDLISHYPKEKLQRLKSFINLFNKYLLSSNCCWVLGIQPSSRGTIKSV